MDDSREYGGLATRLAALQQKLGAGNNGAPKNLCETLNMAQNQVKGHIFLPAPSTQHPAPILIGASKSQPVELLEAAIKLGLKDFGENKVQEAQGKWPALRQAHPHVRLHLIGPLQSNKAADAVALFDVIHTIDRVKIADALADACQKLGKQPQFLIQVNIGQEPQKAGVAPRETAALLDHCRALGLNVIGLMAVPPEGENPAPYFALLKKMGDELGLTELSMGMSSDFEVATRLGATMVRVGTALFGSRG
jgi:pyridoxal phosphate enzyme (YggS family)